MTQSKLNNQHFSIPYITCDFVYSQLIHLDISKSTGSDQISATFFKMVAPIIAHALKQIFNISISKAEFPSPFKLARVVPIHKKCPKIDYTNYRPISVIQIIFIGTTCTSSLKGIPRIKCIVLFQTVRL